MVRLFYFGIAFRTVDEHTVSHGSKDVCQGLPTPRMLKNVEEIVFEVTQEGNGGFVAECLTEPIFTQADDWASLRDNVKEAVAASYFDRSQRPVVRLHFVRDEVLAQS